MREPTSTSQLEMVARATDQQTANLRNRCLRVRLTDQRRGLEKSHRRLKLAAEHVRSGRAVLSPPAFDRLDLRVGCAGKPDAIPPHPRRSLARTSSAGITSPR